MNTLLAVLSFAFAALACLILTAVMIAAGATVNAEVMAGYALLLGLCPLAAWAVIRP